MVRVLRYQFAVFLILGLSVIPILGLQGSLDIQAYGTIRSAPIPAIPIPQDGNCYHMLYCNYNPVAPTPAEGRASLIRFVDMLGRAAYAAENAATICVQTETFWMLSGPNSWKPLMDEGLFKAFIISINPYLRAYPSDANTENGPTATQEKIANGDYDNWLAVIADQCKNFKNPSGTPYAIMIKIGVEVNCNQGGGQSWVADYGATPSAFIAAWRHIVGFFRDHGVTNVCWCLSLNWEDHGPHHFSEYYPGDDYVDWIGIDAYRWGPLDVFENQIAEIYNYYRSVKPIGITEWGVRLNTIPPTTDAEGQTYVDGVFDSIETKPEIKFIRYHWASDSAGNRMTVQNDDPTSTNDDYRPDTVLAYANRIANSRYLTEAAGV